MSDEYQKELFEEFKNKKGKFEKIADKITERRQKFYINMPLENTVVITIIVIMCIIVAFALGVERGKGLLPAPMAVSEESIVSKEKVSPPEVADVGVPKAGEPEEAEELYTIQLISYKQKRFAENEKNKLLKRKINAFIIPAGKWHQVCAGRYSSISEAKKALKKLKNEYIESFIRRTKEG